MAGEAPYRHRVIHGETAVQMLAPGREEIPSGLRLDLPHHGLCRSEGRGVRLQPQPCR